MWGATCVVWAQLRNWRWTVAWGEIERSESKNEIDIVTDRHGTANKHLIWQSPTYVVVLSFWLFCSVVSSTLTLDSNSIPPWLPPSATILTFSRRNRFLYSLSLSLTFSHSNKHFWFLFLDSFSKSWWRYYWKMAKTTSSAIGRHPASTTTRRKPSSIRFPLHR
jgi:hypothetical protein